MRCERVSYGGKNDIAYNGETFVIVGDYGLFLSSTDLDNWQNHDFGLLYDFKRVIWNGSGLSPVILFLIVTARTNPNLSPQ